MILLLETVKKKLNDILSEFFNKPVDVNLYKGCDPTYEESVYESYKNYEDTNMPEPDDLLTIDSINIDNIKYNLSIYRYEELMKISIYDINNTYIKYISTDYSNDYTISFDIFCEKIQNIINIEKNYIKNIISYIILNDYPQVVK